MASAMVRRWPHPPPLLLLALYYWASKDSGVDGEIAKERFRAEQELRWLRRSGESAGAPTRNFK